MKEVWAAAPGRGAARPPGPPGPSGPPPPGPPSGPPRLIPELATIARFQSDKSDPSVIVFSEINVVNFRTPLTKKKAKIPPAAWALPPSSLPEMMN